MQKKVVAVLILLLMFAAIIGIPYFYNKSGIGGAKLPVVTIDKTNGYKLLIDGKPFLIKGVCYSPIPIGKDYEYNFWGDPNKPWIVDGKLMREMGVNTVRFYRLGKNPTEVKQVVDDLYQQFGIRSLMGTYLGFWDWPPPNYADAEFTEKVRTQVLEMVNLYKDSPGVLAWVLGNENNYSFDQNVQRWTTDAIDAMSPEDQKKEKARIYYSFVNSLAKQIKAIDTRHPVVMGVGETASLQYAKDNCPDIDAIGMIAYRGPGFGNLFRQIKQKFDVPVIMTEWGCDSFNAATREADEASQADFIKLQWKDIERNTAGGKGESNVLGGAVFEWNDEWWKGNENLPHTWSVHDEAAHWLNASYHFDAQAAERMNMNEEWWGMVSLDPKNIVGGNNERVPKKAYSVLKDLWAEKK